MKTKTFSESRGLHPPLNMTITSCAPTLILAAMQTLITTTTTTTIIIIIIMDKECADHPKITKTLMFGNLLPANQHLNSNSPKRRRSQRHVSLHSNHNHRATVVMIKTVHTMITQSRGLRMLKILKKHQGNRELRAMSKRISYSTAILTMVLVQTQSL
jgi:hypothetical protein